MKLVFPNGEHPQALLSPGANRIGSGPEADIQIIRPGIQANHCEIHVVGAGCNLQIPQGTNSTVAVNGRPVRDLIALRSGDNILIGDVQARYIRLEAAKPGLAAAEPSFGDTGATRIRTIMPKYVLRGVSGSLFGKVFPITGPTTIGRTSECDIRVESEEVSRRHCSLKPTAQGLSVEDLGSSNGTFINNKRIQQAFLNPGDELRLDTMRLVLVTPGSEFAQPAPAEEKPKDDVSSSNRTSTWVAVMLILAAGAVIAMMILNQST